MGNFSVEPSKEQQAASAGAAALPALSVRPAPHKRNSSHPTGHMKPEDALVPAGVSILSQLAGTWKELRSLSPCRALSFIKSPSAIPLPWLFIWLGVMGEGAAPFFVTSTGTFSVSFSSVHLKPPIRINYDSTLCKYERQLQSFN